VLQVKGSLCPTTTPRWLSASSPGAPGRRPRRCATTSGSGCSHAPSAPAENALIRLYQDAGFTLKEIRQLLAAGSRPRPSWTPLAERKIAELDARIAEAQRAKDLLEHALNCPHDDLLTCPNFRAALQARLKAGPQAAR